VTAPDGRVVKQGAQSQIAQSTSIVSTGNGAPSYTA